MWWFSILSLHMRCQLNLYLMKLVESQLVLEDKLRFWINMLWLIFVLALLFFILLFERLDTTFTNYTAVWNKITQKSLLSQLSRWAKWIPSYHPNSIQGHISLQNPWQCYFLLPLPMSFLIYLLFFCYLQYEWNHYLSMFFAGLCCSWLSHLRKLPKPLYEMVIILHMLLVGTHSILACLNRWYHSLIVARQCKKDDKPFLYSSNTKCTN